MQPDGAADRLNAAEGTNVLLVILMSIAIHSSYVGSKVVVSLFALDLGASQVTVGVLAALYAVVPLLLGVYSGRLADTRGMRLPLYAGAICTVLAMLAGFAGDALAWLIAIALLAGTGFVLYNVAIQNLAGAIGRPEQRASNFNWLAIGYSASAFAGPMVAGFSIDNLGHNNAFLLFACFSVIPIAVLVLKRQFARVETRPSIQERRNALDILRNPALRRLIIISGLTVASSDLYAFYVPVFAHSIGLSASTTGVILGTYAAAIFITRFLLPALLRRVRTERVMIGSMLLAATGYAVFPLLHSVYPLLLISFAIGVGMGCVQPVLMTVSYEKSPPGRTGEVTGLRLTANNIARVIVPMVSGALGAAFGVAPVFWLNALNLAAVSYMSRKG